MTRWWRRLASEFSGRMPGLLACRPQWAHAARMPGFQALIPGYLEKTIAPGAGHVVWKDHVHCVRRVPACAGERAGGSAAASVAAGNPAAEFSFALRLRFDLRCDGVAVGDGCGCGVRAAAIGVVRLATECFRGSMLFASIQAVDGSLYTGSGAEMRLISPRATKSGTETKCAPRKGQQQSCGCSTVRAVEDWATARIFLCRGRGAGRRFISDVAVA